MREQHFQAHVSVFFCLSLIGHCILCKKIYNSHTYGFITQRQCDEKLYFDSITFTSTMMNCNWLMSNIQCKERNHCWMNIIRFSCGFLVQFRLQFSGTYVQWYERILYHTAKCPRCQIECSCSQNLPCSNYRRIICSCRYYQEHPKILL